MQTLVFFISMHDVAILKCNIYGSVNPNIFQLQIDRCGSGIQDFIGII